MTRTLLPALYLLPMPAVSLTISAVAVMLCNENHAPPQHIDELFRPSRIWNSAISFAGSRPNRDALMGLLETGISRCSDCGGLCIAMAQSLREIIDCAVEGGEIRVVAFGSADPRTRRWC